MELGTPSCLPGDGPAVIGPRDGSLVPLLEAGRVGLSPFPATGGSTAILDWNVLWQNHRTFEIEGGSAAQAELEAGLLSSGCAVLRLLGDGIAVGSSGWRPVQAHSSCWVHPQAAWGGAPWEHRAPPLARLSDSMWVAPSCSWRGPLPKPDAIRTSDPRAQKGPGKDPPHPRVPEVPE